MGAENSIQTRTQPNIFRWKLITTLRMPTTAKIPGRADADRAAEVLVATGVSKVLLFSLVARGEATEDSDIDLVAIYDDLDYADRFARKLELSRLVEAEIGYPADVIVRDRPEWRIRTERVPTSFESRVGRYGFSTR